MTSISIIIPVYNTEKYLRRCLDSIAAQTYKDFEVILVDDGSTDGSGKICEEYVAKESRFRVYHNPNGGPSRARNFGLDKSRGEYVLFIDSDDWLEKDALWTYSKAINTYNPDVVKTGFRKNILDGKSEIVKVNEIKFLHSQLDMYFEVETDGYAGFLWNTVFKRNVIGKERFDESINWLEDHVFSFQVFSHCHSMLVMPEVTYNYMVNQGKSLSDISNPQLVLDASKKEYEAHKRLFSEDKDAAEMNNYFLACNTIFALYMLYDNCSYRERVRFRRNNSVNKDLLHRNRLIKLFYLPLPFFISDSLFRFYRFLSVVKSNIKRYYHERG